MEGHRLGQGSFKAWTNTAPLHGLRALALSLCGATLCAPLHVTPPLMNWAPLSTRWGLGLHSQGPDNRPGPRGLGSRPLLGQTCGTWEGPLDKCIRD